MSSLLLKARAWLEPQIGDEDDQQRVIRLNRIFLIIAALLAGLRALGVVGALPGSAPLIALAAGAVLASLALLWSQRLGRVRLTAILSALVFWLTINAGAVLAGGVDRPLFATNMTVLIFVALALGGPAVAAFALASVLAGVAMYVARLDGLLPTPPISADLVVGATTQLVNIAGGALYLGLAAHDLQQALRRSVQNSRGLSVQNQALNSEIAERRQAEDKLLASEQSLQALYQKAQRQAQELSLLDEVRTALAREVELSTLMRTVVEAIASTFGYRLVSIYLLEGDTLVMQHEVGYGDTAFPRIPVTHGIIGRVGRTGQPLLITDVSADPGYLEASAGVTSEVCVPVLDQGRVAGVFNVESTSDLRLDEADLRLMQALSEHITIALQRARLLAQTQASEQRFRSLVEHGADAIALLSGDGTIQYRSPVAGLILGYAAGEYSGRKFQEWMHPDDLPAVGALLGRVLREPGASATAEVRCHHKDGQWIWIEGTLTNLLDEPSVRAVVVNYREVTERKTSQAALHESEERFRRLSEAAFEGILIHDQGLILDANQVMADLFGFHDPRELIGRNGFDVLPMSPESRRLIRESARDGSSRPADITIVRPDGSSFPAETQGHEMVVNGRSVRVVAMRDITERKRAEAELRRRLAERDAVAKVSTVLRAAETLDEMLPLLLDETLAVLNTGAGSILLYEPASETLRQAVGRDWFTALASAPQRLHEGIAGLVVSTGEVYRSREFASDPRSRPVNRALIPPGWGGACVPIRSAREVVGVLFVAVESPRELVDDEVRLLTTLAEIAGSAVHRTRLHQQTERNLQRLAALRTIDLAIVSNFDLKTSLQVLLDQAATQVGADATAVLRLNPLNRRLDVVAAQGFRGAVMQNSLSLDDSAAGRVALERRPIFIPDLREAPEPGARAPLLQLEGFVAYQGLPLVAKGQVKGVLEIFQRSPWPADLERMAFLEALAGQAAIAIENAQLLEDLQRSNTELVLAYDATIEGWSRTLDLREHDTADHTRRVTEMSLRLARSLGVSEEDLVHLRRGALLHDIGKMSIPDSILLKPGPLTPQEWTVMRRHPQMAFELLFPINFLRPALDIPYCHHEKWDGTGYPRGLKQQEIPLAARLFAIVDVWDALCFDRPYRLAWPESKVLGYLREQSSRHFDPQVAEAFLDLARDTTGKI